MSTITGASIKSFGAIDDFLGALGSFQGSMAAYMSGLPV